MASINQPINQSINQSTNQSINQSINQLINQSINQSTNRSINQSISHLEDKLILVADIISAHPGGFSGGHLDYDTPYAPHITLAAIPHRQRLTCVIETTSSDNLTERRKETML